MKTTGSIALLALSLASQAAQAMDYKPMTLALYAKGEVIAAQEYVAANEAVVDYVNTLPRPTFETEPKLFKCQVKSRSMSSYVTRSGNTDPYGQWIDVLTVYDVKECVPK